jgi:hypothetical protein
MQYGLRTLLLVLAIAPALIAGAWFGFLLLAEALAMSRAEERQGLAEHVFGAAVLIVVGTFVVAMLRPRP